MDLEALTTFMEQHGIRKVKLAGTDIDGILRGKYVSLDKFRGAAKNGFGFCDVIFGWDSQDVCYDFSSVTGWNTGFPDTLARIDLDSHRMIPWEPGTAMFLCDFWQDRETPLSVCPRNLLKRIVGRAGAMGYQPRASVEYEFWIFRETPHTLQEKGFQGLTPLSPGSFGYSVLRAAENARLVHDIFDACSGMHVNLEGLHTETGPGVYEAAITVESALEAADQAVLFKQIVKEIASRYDCVATFMARWSAQEAGSSGHLHQSLWDLHQHANRFYDADDPQHCSSVLKQYVAGMVTLMPDVMAMVCPTINSYKRTVPGAWAPESATWGQENRTAAVRVIPGFSSSSTRAEYRLAGADANPYLALAASIGSGLYGIEASLELPPAVSGNAYESDAPRLPRTLEEAAGKLERSSVAAAMFGEEFIRHFVATRRWEVRQFQRAVTDWELRRYFEAI